jgi:hypothetical protein
VVRKRTEMLSRAIACARSTSASASAAIVRGVHTEAKIAELGLVLPTSTKPAANYIMCNRVGNMIYTGA